MSNSRKFWYFYAKVTTTLAEVVWFAEVGLACESTSYRIPDLTFVQFDWY